MNQLAQAHAIRAFDYMQLAPYFQFSYATSADKPCVPILTGTEDYFNNPRATVKQVYELILKDLDFAIAHLQGYTRPSKQYIDLNVAYGLRARANLLMGNWAAAAADADKAMDGYTPASIAEVSVPAFDNIADHNWIWGVDITEAQLKSNSNAGYQNASSWLSAFSGEAYAAATGNVPVINKLLFDKIPSTDVRKGWWLDANKHSPNWANITWTDPSKGTSATGDAIADFEIENVKTPFDAYTNIKFGQQSGIGNTLNNNDFPLMRVEEMILIRQKVWQRVVRRLQQSRFWRTLSALIVTLLTLFHQPVRWQMRYGSSAELNFGVKVSSLWMPNGWARTLFVSMLESPVITLMLTNSISSRMMDG